MYRCELFLFTVKRLEKMKKYKNVYVFLGRTLLYFCIVLGLLYFFSYLGQSQGEFIYNGF